FLIIRNLVREEKHTYNCHYNDSCPYGLHTRGSNSVSLVNQERRENSCKKNIEFRKLLQYISPMEKLCLSLIPGVQSIETRLESKSFDTRFSIRNFVFDFNHS